MFWGSRWRKRDEARVRDIRWKTWQTTNNRSKVLNKVLNQTTLIPYSSLFLFMVICFLKSANSNNYLRNEILLPRIFRRNFPVKSANFADRIALQETSLFQRKEGREAEKKQRRREETSETRNRGRDSPLSASVNSSSSILWKGIIVTACLVVSCCVRSITSDF